MMIISGDLALLKSGGYVVEYSIFTVVLIIVKSITGISVPDHYGAFGVYTMVTHWTINGNTLDYWINSVFNHSYLLLFLIKISLESIIHYFALNDLTH
jgi:hypothetical protein